MRRLLLFKAFYSFGKESSHSQRYEPTIRFRLSSILLCFWNFARRQKNPGSPDFTRLPGFTPGGDKRDRTADLLNAIQALSQLSYTPVSRIDITRNCFKCQVFFYFFSALVFFPLLPDAQTCVDRRLFCSVLAGILQIVWIFPPNVVYWTSLLRSFLQAQENRKEPFLCS